MNNLYCETTALEKLLSLDKRIKAVQGGTSASKTISILMILIAKAQSDTSPTLTSIVSETMPHIKRGSEKDFLDIMKKHGYYQDSRWNASDHFYEFETGSKIEFFSADQPDKARGPRRERLFMNECNNIPYDVFDQLEVRTSQEIWLDWNPVNEFWYYTEIQGKRTDYDHIILTYLDNEGLPDTIKRSIEQRRKNVAWWRVYGQGLLGEVEGKIYKGWKQIKEIPHEAKLIRRWIDFGYSNDPTSIGELYSYNGGYIVNEILHQKGLSNKEIADTILNQEEQCLVIADSSEPKSIDEIKSYGVNIIGCEKGKDSITNGIQIVQDCKISVTEWSLNVIREYRNYLWMRDKKTNKVLNIPEEGFDHAMDGVRYAIASVKKPPTTGAHVHRPKNVRSHLRTY